MVDNVPEMSGDLNSIFSFLRADEMDCIASIREGKLGRTTSNRLFEVRKVFGTNSADIRTPMASFGRDLTK